MRLTPFLAIRYFDKYDVTPRFAFGHGLSYTSFDYSSAAATITNATALASAYPTGGLAVGGKSDLWEEILNVNVTITNSGSVDGNEVAQLYVTFPDEADAPIRSLRGFERVLIATGASTTVDFALRRRDLSHWDVAAQDWKIATGDYTFSVGASSRDLRANVTMTLGA